jgi:glycosyltransferase involved in cell wall biosynthesis
MNNQVMKVDTNDYAAMAKAMGMAMDTGSNKEKADALSRVRINHSPIMGRSEVKGKMVNVEVVSGGTYKLDIPDGPTYYSETATIRPYMQRFMHKRFIMKTADSPNRYVKTVMADNLNIDLKDNDGGFNCGKPAGYIPDFKSLPEKMQDLLKQIKRVRVLFGTIELDNPVDETGASVTIGATPFIWEVENRDAFKTFGTNVFNKLGKMKRLPIQHTVKLATEERKLPNGNCFYLPTVSLDLSNTLDMDDLAQETFANFLAWISNYNGYITNSWDENMHKKEDVDRETVDDFINIDAEDFA